MSVLFDLRRGRALLGATAVLLTLVLASSALAVPSRDQTTTGSTPAPVAAEIAAAKAQGDYYASYANTTPIARQASASAVDTSRPSWLGFALAAGGALLLGAVGGAVSTIVVRRTHPGIA
jgi:hypothetical protein